MCSCYKYESGEVWNQGEGGKWSGDLDLPVSLHILIVRSTGFGCYGLSEGESSLGENRAGARSPGPRMVA